MAYATQATLPRPLLGRRTLREALAALSFCSDGRNTCERLSEVAAQHSGEARQTHHATAFEAQCNHIGRFRCTAGSLRGSDLH